MLKLYAQLMLLTVAEGFSASGTAQVGQTVELSVSADGSPPLVYAWMKNGVPLAGQTQAKLVLAPISKADEGVYVARVMNAAGSTLSDNASIVVTPMIATLTATITSVNYPQPAIIQWRLNGRSIAGANQPTYTFDPNAAPGSYSFSVTWPNPVPLK